MNNTHGAIAYFSMEIGLEAEMPTYSGGLGVLAGDTIRAAADLKIPLVAVTLLHRKGYFYQRLDATGWQSEEPAAVALTHPPADLTTLSKKYGGTFPRAEVMRFIDGERPIPAHGPRHMPVWGEVFRRERADSEARMRVLALTAFIESIQE